MPFNDLNPLMAGDNVYPALPNRSSESSKLSFNASVIKIAVFLLGWFPYKF